MAEDLDFVLNLASEKVVYRKISNNLIPIKEQFRQLLEKYKVEDDLSWLAIEKETDEQTRVTKMFQDAWNKDLLKILGETLCITLDLKVF